MKKRHLIMTVILVAFVATPLMARRSQRGGGQTPTLSAKEVSDLIFLREEEKLARDVYLALYDVWGTPIFLNISSSEQRHTDSVKNLLDKYGLADPVTDDTPGIFTNQELEALYIELVEKGGQSLKDAMQVGVTIEEMDIRDIKDSMLPDATHIDIQRVMTNLLNGSYNHLAAFEKQLAAL